MMTDMENGKIRTIITKDLSRLGRNQLHTGLYIEERFPMFGVRYIAINDDVDTDRSESTELMPFKNLFNEWFIRDTSRKIRAVQRAKAGREERLGTRAPHGYRKDEQDRKKLVVDEEAAAVVRRIFALCAARQGPSQIARLLKREQMLCPTTYAYERQGITHTSLDAEPPYHWTSSTVANMLENEIYLGNTINLRYSTRSYKDKRKVEHPREECMVLENTHPAPGESGSLGYRPAGTPAQTATYQDGRAEQVFRAGGVRRLREYHGAPPRPYHEPVLQPLHLPDLQEGRHPLHRPLYPGVCTG